MRRLLLAALLLAAACDPPGTGRESPQDLGKTSGLLQAAPNGDGDSWKDTHGVEYRLGLVNTPEIGPGSPECYGRKAADKRRALTAQGFYAQSYAIDDHHRHVAVVTLRDGTNLNVYLARYGYANDKYLAQFRHENPALAKELDQAFAIAKAQRLGLWGACGG